MSAIEDTPQNRNFLVPLNFAFQINNTPAVNFFCQKCEIPGIELPSPVGPNPFVDIPHPGDQLQYGKNLKIEFKVDEEMQNYLEIHNWLTGLGKPASFSQRKDIEEGITFKGSSGRSDISVFVLTQSKLPNYTITFIDAFPVKLSGLKFDTTNEDVTFLSAEAEFEYLYYKIEKTT